MLILKDPSFCASAYNNNNLRLGYHVCLKSDAIASCTVKPMILPLMSYASDPILFVSQIDAGGPVILDGYLLGVNSLGTCVRGQLIVATRIQSYGTWITQNL